MLIKNAHAVDPFTGINEKVDVLIKNDKIESVTKAGEESFTDADVMDATGLFLLPGLMDVHVHFRDPGLTHKEDILTGAKAAARGGFTKIVLMANTKPSVDNVETLRYVLDKGKTTPIDIMTCGAVTKNLAGLELTDMEALKEAGAVGFTDDGIPLMDEGLLRKAFEKAEKLGVPVSLHEEDKTLISENGINVGKASEHYGIKGSPSKAEYSLIERDVQLAIETGVKLDIQHISTKEGVEAVRNAQKKSRNIYAEVTPHHIALTEEAVIKYGANAKMNPPLRTEEDRQAIIAGIKDGTIGIVATDHAPHSIEEKSVEITKAPSGIIGLETAFDIAYENLVMPGHISIMDLVGMFTKNPCKLYGLKNDGIEKGASADMVLFNPSEGYVYEKSFSKSSNSPFFGHEFKTRIEKTICKGKVIYEAV